MCHAVENVKRGYVFCDFTSKYFISPHKITNPMITNKRIESISYYFTAQSLKFALLANAGTSIINIRSAIYSYVSSANPFRVVKLYKYSITTDT